MWNDNEDGKLCGSKPRYFVQKASPLNSTKNIVFLLTE